MSDLRDFNPPWANDGLGVRGVPTPIQKFGGMVDFPPSRIAQTMQPGNEPLLGPGQQGPSGGGSTAPGFSFQCLTQTISGVTSRGIYSGSILIQSFDHTDTLSITGLLTSVTPTPTDAGWIVTSTTDYGWLEIDVDASAFPFTFSGAAIKSISNGDMWGGGEVQNDGGMGTPIVYSQDKIRIVIYEMDVGPNGNPAVINQWVRDPLRIEMTNYLDSNDASGGSDETILAAYVFPT